MTASDAPVLQPGIDALLDCAAVVRPDVDREDLRGALVAAHEAGWPWPRTFKAAARILADGEEPRDLREAVRDPLNLRTHRRGRP